MQLTKVLKLAMNRGMENIEVIFFTHQLGFEVVRSEVTTVGMLERVS